MRPWGADNRRVLSLSLREVPRYPWKMKILLVDDYPQNRELLAMILDDEGHTCVDAADGIEACEAFRADLDIDLILMDINMPNMDGISATRQIKSECGDRFVPVIFVTALDNPDILVRCLNAGGDDFVPKPVNETVLMAKIHAHARSKALYTTLQSANKSLRYHQQVMNREHAIVEHIFANSSRRNKTYCRNIRHYTSPMSMFDGDVVLSAPSPTGGNYLMVGDFTGHGLAAAIGSLPVTEIFYDLAERQASISQLAATLNQRLFELLPISMFCCATLLYVDAGGERCTVWSGGMNDLLWVKRIGEAPAKIEAQHMPLGILNESEFDNSPQLFVLAPGERLYVYTDGVNEAVNLDGEEFGLARLENLVAGGGDNMVERVKEAVTDFHQGADQSDDLSIVEFTAGPLVHLRSDDHAEVDVRATLLDISSFPWQLQVRLMADDLRNPRIIDDILHMLMGIKGMELHQDNLFTVVSELYNNALDYGVLRLASARKDTLGGYDSYFAERKNRLASSLADEFIQVDLRYLRGEPNQIRLVITSSGEGFDSDSVLARDAAPQSTARRGLLLLKKLCSSLAFSDGGRTVTATYDLCQPPAQV